MSWEEVATISQLKLGIRIFSLDRCLNLIRSNFFWLDMSDMFNSLLRRGECTNDAHCKCGNALQNESERTKNDMLHFFDALCPFLLFVLWCFWSFCIWMAFYGGFLAWYWSFSRNNRRDVGFSDWFAQR